MEQLGSQPQPKQSWLWQISVSVALISLAFTTFAWAVSHRFRRPALPIPAPVVLRARASDVLGGAVLIDGKPTAPFSLVEFSDYQCPPCRQQEPHLAKFMHQHGDKVRWLVRDLPLPMHPHAYDAACVA